MQISHLFWIVTKKQNISIISGQNFYTSMYGKLSKFFCAQFSNN